MFSSHGAPIAVAACLFALAQGVSAQTPPNDECTSPTPIAGTGSWNLDDLLTATQSAAPPPIPGTSFDVWFCWTPTWAGTASIDVSGGALWAQVYLGCGCPAPGAAPIASASLQAPTAAFPVECDQRYLVRIASEIYPYPPQNPTRVFSLDKVDAQDCPPPSGPPCDECCGAKPVFDDAAGVYRANYTGQVAVATQSFFGQFGSGGQVLTIFNLAATPPPVPGVEWNPIPGAPTTAFRYSQPNWDLNTLGSIFPLTLDDRGNIYTAYCAATNSPRGSALGNSTSGSIFQIPTGSGLPVVFCNIPDNAAPAIGNCAGGAPLIPCNVPNPCPPGIGDVCCDCEHGSQFFASDFADGRIYRISAAGVPLECFDHATNTVQTPIREAGNTYDQYVRLGERVWAVKAHQGRLYYSVWGQDFGCTNPPPIAPGSVPNRIWSVALTATGAFVPSSRRLEFQVPAFPNTPSGGFNPQSSAPVSDISFSPTCRMLLAERAMGENGVLVGAHAERGLEYAFSGSAWVPVNYRNAYGYPIGLAPTGNPNTNAAGGCDYDFTPAAPNTPLGLAWFTADFMTSSPAYGIVGLDPVAPSLATDVPIDYNSTAGVQDKTKQGDVEIPCPIVCATFGDDRVLCNPGQPIAYTWTFTFTNNTTVPIQYILLSDPNFAQHVITLPTLLPPGQTSGPITVGLLAGLPPGEFCFDVTFADETVHECCRVRHCITIPNCDCLQFPRFEAHCAPGQPNVFTLTFTLQNLGGMTSNQIYIIPPAGVMALPDFFSIPLLAPFQTTAPLITTITGAAPGSQLCLRFSIHLDGEECCSDLVCLTVPQPCPPGTMPTSCSPLSACYADCDGSGSLNVNDFVCFINHFAAGDPCANCDASSTPPVLNVNDFVCYQGKFVAGCP